MPGKKKMAGGKKKMAGGRKRRVRVKPAMPGKGIGGDIGSWVGNQGEKLVRGWLGFGRGPAMPMMPLTNEYTKAVLF